MSDSIQLDVDALFGELIADGAEAGLQATVIRHGEVVAESCAGLTGEPTAPEVQRGSLFFAGSTAKGILSSLTHVLVARGALDYELRVAEVWPEFAAHGKAAVSVRHVLLHQAGVPGLPADITAQQLCDWERMCAWIADQAPWWEPGSVYGYHAQTFGFLLGETLQRATGRPLGELLRAELTGPLGVAEEVHFAVPPELLHRVARQLAPEGPPPPGPEPGTLAARVLPPGAVPDAAFANRRDVLTANIPSIGTMSARGAARVYAGLLGHLPGGQAASLLDARRRDQVAAVSFTGTDHVMGNRLSWALGYGVERPSGASTRPGSTFGMVGMNGSAAYADIDTGVAVALMRNRFSSDFTAIARLDELIAERYPSPRPPS